MPYLGSVIQCLGIQTLKADSPGLNFLTCKTEIINSKELFKELNQTTQVRGLAIFNANVTLKQKAEEKSKEIPI